MEIWRRIGMMMLAVWLGGTLASGQEINARVSGLEQDSVYMSLLMQEYRLKAREDSLSTVVRLTRRSFAADTTERLRRADELLKLEESLFEARNRLGVVASKINNIEQEYILQNIGRIDEPAPSPQEPLRTVVSDDPDLIRNTFFKENLSQAEYRQLQDARRRKAELDPLVQSFRKNYQSIESIAQAYDSLHIQRVTDSLFAEYQNRVSLNRQLEAQLHTLWSQPYEQQLYIYSYLLDKLNKMSELARLNERSKASRISDPEGVMSVAFAEYPLQRAVLVEYELALAAALNLRAATDSLNRVKRTMAGENLALDRITLEQKEYVTYEDPTIHDPSVYHAENPIPELWVPESGRYYSVTVGTFSNRQGIPIFRGAKPLYYERIRGQWRYYVGMYRSYGDALEAAAYLKSAGFRRPEVVRWEDRQYQNLASEASKNQGLFRIQIDGILGELPEPVRYQLNRYARHKEIIRAGDRYYVGTFTDRIQVDEVMEALEKIGGLSLKLESMEE